MLKSAILSVGVVAMMASAAVAGVAGSTLVSLDGTMRHEFDKTGDYLGKADWLDAPVAGVYRDEPGVCWLDNTDGSRALGDLVLYIGEVQCCLSTQSISDKVAFTQVWVKGTGNGYGLCRNQVFRQGPN